MTPVNDGSDFLMCLDNMSIIFDAVLYLVFKISASRSISACFLKYFESLPLVSIFSSMFSIFGISRNTPFILVIILPISVLDSGIDKSGLNKNPTLLNSNIVSGFTSYLPQ